MTQTEWLESLKAGDEVVIRTGNYGFEMATIDRTTATQIVIGRNKFRRGSGAKIGYCSGLVPELQQPTPELIERIFRETAIKNIRACCLERLPTDALRKIVELLP